MRLTPYVVPLALMLALAACRPAPAEFSESEAPKALGFDNASAQFPVRFAPGSSQIVAADAARLRALAANGGIAASDRVVLAASGSPALASARTRAIATELLRYGIIARERKAVGLPPNRGVIESGRYVVRLPSCPNWSGPAGVDFTNNDTSNFGCATAVNLGVMVASPADLVEGRPMAMTEAQPAASAVNRYLTDKVQLPAAATVGPIASPSGGAAVAPSGGSGSQP